MAKTRVTLTTSRQIRLDNNTGAGRPVVIDGTATVTLPSVATRAQAETALAGLVLDIQAQIDTAYPSPSGS